MTPTISTDTVSIFRIVKSTYLRTFSRFIGWLIWNPCFQYQRSAKKKKPLLLFANVDELIAFVTFFMFSFLLPFSFFLGNFWSDFFSSFHVVIINSGVDHLNTCTGYVTGRFSKASYIRISVISLSISLWSLWWSYMNNLNTKSISETMRYKI